MTRRRVALSPAIGLARAGCDNAFHEKAGRSQVRFALFLSAIFSFSSQGFLGRAARIGHDKVLIAPIIFKQVS